MHALFYGCPTSHIHTAADTCICDTERPREIRALQGPEQLDWSRCGLKLLLRSHFKDGEWVGILINQFTQAGIQTCYMKVPACFLSVLTITSSHLFIFLDKKLFPEWTDMSSDFLFFPFVVTARQSDECIC